MPKHSRRKSELATLQRAIAGAVMRPFAPGERIQPASAEVAARFIKPNARLTARDRLQIYNQQYWWRILGSFQEDFRGLRAVLGARKFERLAVAYIEACGSQSWTLRDLGQHLESFLATRPELTAPHTPLALDVSSVEWARVIAFDGPELPPIDPANLARRAAECLRFRLQPYITLLTLTHPVDKLLGRLRARSIETANVSNAVTAGRRRSQVRLTASPSREPIHLAVHRVEFSVYYKRLEPGAARLLTALRDGATLADACARAFDHPPPDAAEKIQAWFAQWTRFGWLCMRP
jgi:hypothetical protein